MPNAERRMPNAEGKATDHSFDIGSGKYVLPNALALAFGLVATLKARW
jgi:hypothetical protein